MSFSRSTVRSPCARLDARVRAFNEQPLEGGAPWVLDHTMFIQSRQDDCVQMPSRGSDTVGVHPSAARHAGRFFLRPAPGRRDRPPAQPPQRVLDGIHLVDVPLLREQIAVHRSPARNYFTTSWLSDLLLCYQPQSDHGFFAVHVGSSWKGSGERKIKTTGWSLAFLFGPRLRGAPLACGQTGLGKGGTLSDSGL